MIGRGRIFVDGFVVGEIVTGTADETSSFSESTLASLEQGDSPLPSSTAGAEPHHHGPVFRHGIGPGSSGDHHGEMHHERQPTFRRGIGPGSKSRSEESTPPHFTIADIRQAVDGKGSSGRIDRSGFKSEVDNNEAMKKRAAAMVIGEVGADAPEKAKTIQLETAFNRAGYRGHSLEQALWDTSHHGSAGYYPQETFTRGYDYIKSHPEWYENFKNTTLAKVLAGSNESDQGLGPMTGNASADVAAHQINKGTPYYHEPRGDTYFREGPFTHPLPTLPQNPVGVTRLGAGGSAPSEARQSLPPGNRFDYFQRAGLSPSQVPRETVETPYGPITVASAAAKDFEGFYKDLHEGGAPIKTIGSYANRDKRWSGGKSSHAYGAATDIDDAVEQSSAMKSWIATHQAQWSKALQQHHMGWGANFSHYDPNHIEWLGPGETEQANK